MASARYAEWHLHRGTPSYDVGHPDLDQAGGQLVLDPYEDPLPVVAISATDDGSRRFDVLAPDGTGTVVLDADGRSGTFALSWIRGRLERAVVD